MTSMQDNLGYIRLSHW